MDDTRAATPNTIIVVSTLPVLAKDPQSKAVTPAPMVTISPPLTSFFCPNGETCSTYIVASRLSASDCQIDAGRSLPNSTHISEVQVLGCDIHVHDTKANVQTSSIPYQVIPERGWTPYGVWSDWSLSAVSKNPILANVSSYPPHCIFRSPTGSLESDFVAGPI